MHNLRLMFFFFTKSIEAPKALHLVRFVSFLTTLVIVPSTPFALLTPFYTLRWV